MHDKGVDIARFREYTMHRCKQIDGYIEKREKKEREANLL